MSEIVLLMDANEGADSRTKEMTELIYECGLIDTHIIKDPYNEHTLEEKNRSTSFSFLPGSNKASRTPT